MMKPSAGITVSKSVKDCEISKRFDFIEIYYSDGERVLLQKNIFTYKD